MIATVSRNPSQPPDITQTQGNDYVVLIQCFSKRVF